MDKFSLENIKQTGKHKGAACLLALIAHTEFHFPEALHKQLEDLCKALVKLERSSSDYARRRWRTEFRLNIRHLEKAVVFRYPSPARRLTKRPRLGHLAAMKRLRAAGWEPLTGSGSGRIHERCARIGVKPRKVKLDGSEFRYWVPSWVLLKATEAQYQRMKKDWRYRRAMLAKALVVKQGGPTP